MRRRHQRTRTWPRPAPRRRELHRAQRSLQRNVRYLEASRPRRQHPPRECAQRDADDRGRDRTLPRRPRKTPDHAAHRARRNAPAARDVGQVSRARPVHDRALLKVPFRQSRRGRANRIAAAARRGVVSGWARRRDRPRTICRRCPDRSCRPERRRWRKSRAASRWPRPGRHHRCAPPS
jgi:hypothetical protein